MADEPKRFHDVAHPGKTAADASSRPVIVSNRPMLKDPMMRDEPVPDSSETEILQSGTHSPIEPTKSFQSEEEDKQPEAEPVAQEQTLKSEPVIETNIENLHTLVEDKTYFVHVGPSKRSKTAVLAVIVPIILIGAAVAGYYIYTIAVK